MMTLTEFEDALDRYGGNIDKWPNQQRSSGFEFLQQTPSARVVHARMLEIERLLRGRADKPLNAALIAQRATRYRQAAARSISAPQIGWAAAAAVAVLFAGLYVGKGAELRADGHDRGLNFLMEVALPSVEPIDGD